MLTQYTYYIHLYNNIHVKHKRADIPSELKWTQSIFFVLALGEDDNEKSKEIHRTLIDRNERLEYQRRA